MKAPFILMPICMTHSVVTFYSINCKYNLPLCILGDFNSRTGNLKDYVDNDFNNSSDNNFLPPDLNDTVDNLNHLGIPLDRSSKDSKINNNGYKLVDLCKNFDQILSCW